MNVVRDTSGITKRQDVSVGIRYATVLSNIPHYKSIAYIYLHLFPIQFQVFLICLISACVKGFTGHNCNVICPFPAYGLDCQSTCNCTEKSCDPGDGCIGHTAENGIVRNNLCPPILQSILKLRLTMFRYFNYLSVNSFLCCQLSLLDNLKTFFMKFGSVWILFLIYIEWSLFSLQKYNQHI